VTFLTEGNDRIRDTAGNNCKLVHNRIQDTVAPFLVTVTISLYGYEANNGMRGYVTTGVSLWKHKRPVVVGESPLVSRRSQMCSALEVRGRRSTVPSVGSKEL
jgi:hypothetical protein